MGGGGGAASFAQAVPPQAVPPVQIQLPAEAPAAPPPIQFPPETGGFGGDLGGDLSGDLGGDTQEYGNDGYDGYGGGGGAEQPVVAAAAFPVEAPAEGPGGFQDPTGGGVGDVGVADSGAAGGGDMMPTGMFVCM